MQMRVLSFLVLESLLPTPRLPHLDLRGGQPGRGGVERRSQPALAAPSSLQEFVKDAGSYSKKLVDDLLDQITGGDHSRMLFRLRQVGASPSSRQMGAGSVCEVTRSCSSPRVGYLPGKPKKDALVWHMFFIPF